MSNVLRRLSASISGTSKDSDDSESTSGIFRRKSSSASSSEDNSNYRPLGARDYKLAISPAAEEATQKSSVSTKMADMVAMECAARAAGGDEDVTLVREDTKERISGSRD